MDHQASVGKLPDSTGWRATCSCGWAGNSPRSEAEAIESVNYHYANMGLEPVPEGSNYVKGLVVSSV